MEVAAVVASRLELWARAVASARPVRGDVGVAVCGQVGRWIDRDRSLDRTQEPGIGAELEYLLVALLEQAGLDPGPLERLLAALIDLCTPHARGVCDRDGLAASVEELEAVICGEPRLEAPKHKAKAQDRRPLGDSAHDDALVKALRCRGQGDVDPRLDVFVERPVTGELGLRKPAALPPQRD